MPTALTPIAWQTLGTAATSVTFSSIPSTYRDLMLVMQTGTTIANFQLYLQLNSDTTNIYKTIYMAGNGSVANTWQGTANGIYLSDAVTPNTATAAVTTQILDYSATDKYKTTLTRFNNSASWVGANAGLWQSTSAINSLTISVSGGGTTLLAGSTFALYGIAG